MPQSKQDRSTRTSKGLLKFSKLGYGLLQVVCLFRQPFKRSLRPDLAQWKRGRIFCFCTFNFLGLEQVLKLVGELAPPLKFAFRNVDTYVAGMLLPFAKSGSCTFNRLNEANLKVLDVLS